MALPAHNRANAFVDFQPFEAAKFDRILSPQERKIVLRDTPLESLRRLTDFADSLERHPDPTIGNPAYNVSMEAWTLMRFMSEQTGAERLFQPRPKQLARAMGMEPSETIAIPSLDSVINTLSINMFYLAKRLKGHSIEAIVGQIPPKKAEDRRSAYEKVFGRRPEEAA